MAQRDDLDHDLNHPDPTQRQAVIRALVQQRAINAIDALRQLAERDPDAQVRALADSAAAFLEREQAEASLWRPRRQATTTPDLSEDALRSKEAALRARQPGTAEFILLGVLVALVGVMFVLLLAGGFNALRERLEATPLPQARDVVVAEMRQVIAAAREKAEQLRQVPTLIANSADGLPCEYLPAVPATYRLPDSERAAYPELGGAENALYQAHITLHDVEARWRRQCRDGWLTEAPAHVTGPAEAFIDAGLASLAEAEAALERLPPVPTAPAFTPTAVSGEVYSLAGSKLRPAPASGVCTDFEGGEQPCQPQPASWKG